MTLKGSRRTVRKRILAIFVIAAVVPFLLVASGRISLGGSAQASTPDLYRLDRSVLVSLTNMTDVTFSPSGGGIPYYVVTVNESQEKLLGLLYLTTDVAPEWTYGFNSELSVITLVSVNGTIESLRIWNNQESWGYMITQRYLNAFIGHSVFDNLQVGKDVSTVTGATYTSEAIANGIREAGRLVIKDHNSENGVAVDPFQKFLSTAAAMVQPADIADAGVVAGLFAMAVLAYRIDSDKLKYAVLGASVLFIGFYRARMISIVDVSQIVTLAFPPIFTNLYWYLLFGLGLATSLVWGRMYCGYLCPFGAFTQILHRLSPIDARIPLWIHTKASYLKYAFLIFVVAGIMLGGLWVVGFEPFQTFFSSQGALWMWIVMGLAVVLSIPFERFYCSYVCPAGAALSLVGSLRVKEINRWPECARCKICQNACPEGAITGAKISTLRCMNCRVCEKNYLDDRLCPHYAILRAASRAGTGETAGTT